MYNQPLRLKGSDLILKLDRKPMPNIRKSKDKVYFSFTLFGVTLKLYK